MKNIYTLILIALTIVKAFSQEKYNSYDDYVIKTSSFIFEGNVIDREILIDKEQRVVFNITKIQISDIFRNEKDGIKTGTILIVEKDEAKQVMEDGTILINPPSHYSPIPIPDKGIYFCIEQKHKSSLIRTNTDNLIILKPTASISFYNLQGFNKTFKSKNEVYSFLKQQPNILIPESLFQKKSEKTNDVKNQNPIVCKLPRK